MKRLLILGLLAVTAHAADWTKIRRIAQVAGCAASMVDAGTTLRPGIIETNPLLGRGTPNAGRIIGIKLGMCAGQIAFSEWRHARHGARDERTAALFGFGQAALYGAVSVHNLGIRTEVAR